MGVMMVVKSLFKLFGNSKDKGFHIYMNYLTLTSSCLGSVY